MALLLPQLAPFTLALGLLALIVTAEIGSVLIGASVSGMIDGALPDLDTDIDVGEPGQIAPEIGGGNVIVSILAWLSVGKVPVLIVLPRCCFLSE